MSYICFKSMIDNMFIDWVKLSFKSYSLRPNLIYAYLSIKLLTGVSYYLQRFIQVLILERA